MRKKYFDPTITLQKVIGDQIYEALNGPVIEYIRQEKDAGETDDFVKEYHENRNMMIEERSFPNLYRICMQAKRAIGFEKDVDFYIVSDSTPNAGSIASNNPDMQPHVVELNSGLIHLLTEQELLYVIGHEIGHLINGDTQIIRLRRFVYGDEKDNVPDFIKNRINLYQLLSEIGADRYGFIACGGDEKVAITAEYKLHSGIDISKMNVNLNALMEENKKHLDYFMSSNRFIGDSHPVHPISIYCLHLYATCKTQEQLDEEMAKIEDRFYNLDEEDATFNYFYVAAGYLLSNIDGEPSDSQKQEIAYKVGVRCWFPAEFIDQVLQTNDLEQLYHNTVKLLADLDEDNKVVMLDFLVDLAFRDGKFSEQELHFIYRFGHEVGWNDEQIAYYISGLISRHFIPNVLLS